MIDYLHFLDDVCYVDGAIEGAVYFKNQNDNIGLFIISQEANNFLKKLKKNDYLLKELNEKEKKFIDLLVNKKIIELKKIKPITKTNKYEKINTLSSAWVEITNKCNFKCIHCYNIDNSIRDTIDRKKINCIFEQLIENNIKKIQLIGGEPLLEKNIVISIIKKYRKKFESIEILSNGSLITNDICRFFYNYDIKIAISILSGLEEKYNKITQNKMSYKKVMDSVNLLKKHNIKVRFSFIKMKLNSEENIDEIKKIWGINELRQDNVRKIGRCDNVVSGSITHYENPIQKIRQGFAFNKFNYKMIYHECFSRSIYIACNLNVYPCVMERKYCYGNLTTSSFNEIITNQKKIAKFTRDIISQCKFCIYRYICNDCTINNINNTLDINSIGWNCIKNEKSR